MKIISAFVIFLATLPALVKAVDVEKVISEQIYENIGFEIIKTNTSPINLVLIVDVGNKSDHFKEELENYSFQSGIQLKNLKSLQGNKYQITTTKEQLSELLAVVVATVKGHEADLSFLRLIILGNFSEQKTVGYLYSHFKKLNAKPKTIPGNIFTAEISSDSNKSKEDFWNQIISTLLVCNSQNLNNVNYKLTKTHIHCAIDKLPAALSEGDIASLKSSFKNKLNVDIAFSQSLVNLLSNFEMENNFELVKEFPSYLDEVSVESISFRYHELINSETGQYKQSINKQIKEKINSDGNVRYLPSSSDVWSFAIVLNGYVAVCDYIDCTYVSSNFTFKYIYDSRTILRFDFPKNNSTRVLSKIQSSVLNPLFKHNQNIRTSDLKFIFIGPTAEAVHFNFSDESVERNDEQDLIELIVRNPLLNDNTYCVDSLTLNDRNWIISKLFSYGFIRYFNQTEIEHHDFKLLFSNCLSKLEKVELSDLFEKYYSQMNRDYFSQIKSALEARLKLLSEDDPDYRFYLELYDYDIKSVQSNLLQTITFEDFQLYYEKLKSSMKPAQS